MNFKGSLLLDIIQNVALMGMIAYLLTRVPAVRRTLLHSKERTHDKRLLMLIFGCFSILGNWLGIPVLESMANTRIVGPIVGGLLGGPMVGIGAGVIGAIPRYFMGGFTMWASVLANILAGAISGWVHAKLGIHRLNVWIAFGTGILCELVLKVMVIVLSEPFEKAVELERVIGIPTIIANSLAAAFVIHVIKDVFSEQQKAQAESAQQAIKVVQQASGLFQSGFNEANAAHVAQMIRAATGAAAVAITDTEKILAFVGIGADHHIAGMPIMTTTTKLSMKNCETIIANSKEEIGCPHPACLLSAAIDAPLIVGGKLMGTLKLYKTGRDVITPYEVELIKGIVVFLSFQLAQQQLEQQRLLLSQTEFDMLKAQINPHFLFNTLGTIWALIRTEQDAARTLVKDLATILRSSINREQETTTLQLELDLVHRYFRIEKARFGDRIDLVVDVTEELLSCNLPVFTLQPLVENAVKHGLLQEEQRGQIAITARKDYSFPQFQISIEDNGVGINQHILRRLLAETGGDSIVTHSGIGVYNVDKRIKLLYGDNYGLSLASTPGVGTKVTITLPLR